MPFQQVLDLALQPSHGRQDFIASTSNEEALLWMDLWPGWPGHALAVWGPPQCGKTHLAEIWRSQANGANVNAALLTTELAGKLSGERVNIVIDDADLGLGRPGYEHALLHLYNMLKENGGSLLLTGHAPPARWQIGVKDLKSRLSSMASVAIAPPDDELITRLLVKLAADRQLAVPPEVIAYLVPRMERSFAAASRIAARLDHIALAEKRHVTVAVARAALALEA